MSVEVMGVLARVVDVAGIGIIFWGVGVGLVGFLFTLVRSREGTSFFQAHAQIRCKVGTYLLLGLEILIASDVAETVIDPMYENLIALGAIVVIRTILSFFLSRELEAITSQS